MDSSGSAILAILFLTVGIVGGVITNSIAYLPTPQMGYPPSTVLGLGFASVFALIVGVVLLLVWLVKQMY